MNSPAPEIRTGRDARKRAFAGWLGVLGVYLFVGVLLIFGRIVSEEFWTTRMMMQVLRDASILGIVSVGLAFVTYGGHFVDLSIPVIMAVGGIVGVVLTPFLGFFGAVAAGMLAGALMGLINGWVIGYLRVNPIIWTLAALALFDGITRWAYGGKWVYVESATAGGALFEALYRHDLFGVVPLIVLIFLFTAVTGHFLMRHTVLGRRLGMTGASWEAARLSGIPVHRTIMTAFVLCGTTAALGGIFKTSLQMYGDVEIGLTYDFQAITAVVLGGVTLAGGRGNMVGVVGGVLVMGLLGTILPELIGQDEQFIVRGLIFVAVVGISQYALRRAGRDDQ